MTDLAVTLNILKDRLRQFSSEAEVMTAMCDSKLQKSVQVCAPARMGDPRSLRPKLPVEIVDNVFSFAPRNTLQTLLVTNSFIFALAIRYLYRNVTLTRPPSLIAFLRRVVANKDLAALVRSLDINLTKTKQDSDTVSSLNTSRPIPTLNLYQLLHTALLSMPGLLSMSLELPRSDDPVWIFTNCTFRLRQFTTSMYCRRALAAFLETQENIVDLTLRGYQSSGGGAMLLMPFLDGPGASNTVPLKDRFVLSPAALPNLRSFNAVHADADLVRVVVQGRPVEIVSVPLFPDRSIPTLDALLLSSVPLRRLSVISFDPAAPTMLFESVAKRFTDLQALHLVMLMAEYTQEVLVQSAPYLSHFKCLKYITFMAAPSTPPVSPPLAPPPPPVAPAAPATGTSTAAPLPPAAPTAGPSTATATTGGTGTFQGNAQSTLQSLEAAAHTIEGSTRNISEDADGAFLANLDAGEEDIAKKWHRACPTLRTIILPQGRVWFQAHRDTSGSMCDIESCTCRRRKSRKKSKGKGKARATTEDSAESGSASRQGSSEASRSGTTSVAAASAAASGDTMVMGDETEWVPL